MVSWSDRRAEHHPDAYLLIYPDYHSCMYVLYIWSSRRSSPPAITLYCHYRFAAVVLVAGATSFHHILQLFTTMVYLPSCWLHYIISHHYHPCRHRAQRRAGACWHRLLSTHPNIFPPTPYYYEHQPYRHLRYQQRFSSSLSLHQLLAFIRPTDIIVRLIHRRRRLMRSY